MFKSRHFGGNARLVHVESNTLVMKKPEQGKAVRLVQNALIDLGYPLPTSTKKFGSPDGIYGSETKAQVLKLQKDEKLPDKDGIVGHDTITRMDDLLFSRKVPFKPLPPLPPGSPGDGTDEVEDSIEIILETLGSANPLRFITFSLKMVQLNAGGEEVTHEATIPGSGYDRVGQLISDRKIGVEIQPTLLGPALYLPKMPSVAQLKKVGLTTAATENTLYLKRALEQKITDRCRVVHEATHAICDVRNKGAMNALFSEMLAVVAEAIFLRKRSSTAKSTIAAYVAADKIAEKILKREQPEEAEVNSLALLMRFDPDYGELTHGEYQYNGV